MPQLKRFVYSQPKMGSTLSIILYATDSIESGKIALECFQMVDSLVLIYSDYIDSSELNKLSLKAGSGQYVKVSPALFDILSLAKTAYDKSEGTFDITVGPLTRLWRTARKENRFPSHISIAGKRSLTGFNKIKIDTAEHSVLLSQKGMQLDLGGIAQGYIAQRLIDMLKQKNVQHALVDVSGDIAASGAPPGKKGWTIGINVPGESDRLLDKKLVIANKAVTTSGDVYQFMMHNGKKYSHLVDPRTGYGITSQKNVTVIADDAVTADWLTKPCSILSIKKAKKLAEEFHAEVLIAELKKGKVVFAATEGFQKYRNGSANEK